MKHIKIKQTDIKDNDGYFFYEDVFIRILESEIEFQQGRDVVMISKLKLKEVVNWLYSNGCEMAFIDIATADAVFVSQHEGKPIASGSLPSLPSDKDINEKAKIHQQQFPNNSPMRSYKTGYHHALHDIEKAMPS